MINSCIKATRAFVEFAAGMAATFIILFAEIKDRSDDDRRVQDADMTGEMNYRTGRLDSGADPYGWYDED
ncbi:hypothetical protein [Nitrococcus mobilis]|uniref:Uncharacterized protein n=1 Tax=Nitrococcus mobilis Nb-231 TaxID=314278 RepID=A4BQB1_9GAMM|nr:hypothetical protein [Nitrococcus mobilis]EAR22266.1 hypothetical protein NB231_05135 [Nitrococcus mobilis Nb-231]